MRGVRRLPVDDPMNLLTRKPVDTDSPVENSEEEPEILSVESVKKPEDIEPAGLAEPVDTRIQTQTQKETKKTQKQQKETKKAHKETQKMQKAALPQEAEHEREAAQREASQSEVTPQKTTPQNPSQNASQPAIQPAIQPETHPITMHSERKTESSSAVPGSRSKRSLADLCSQTNSAHKRYRVGLSRNVDPLHRKLHNSIN